MSNMAQDPGLNQLLQWSIENSDASRDAAPTDQQRDPSKGLNAEMLQQLLGGPSDADRMRMAMTAILAPIEEVDLENKLTAWDNLEQLIENLDNANNMASLGMWQPLVQQLENTEAEMRRMACWCLSTAVQNNIKSQEQLLALNAIPKLVKLATEDKNQAVRKKAVSALSSEVRNYQPALDELQKAMPKQLWSNPQRLDAAEMDQVDEIISKLREQASRA